MKILLSCLVIIILLVFLIYKSKFRTINSVEEFYMSSLNFRNVFPKDFMIEQYQLYLRNTQDNLESYIVPNNFKYTYLRENLIESLNSSSVGFVMNCKPTLNFKITIPDEFLKSYIRYNISIDNENIEGEYDNFLFYKYFKLKEITGDNSLSISGALSKFNILQTFIREKNFEKLSDHNSNFNTIYELPTRLEGDTRDSNNQVILHMLMFYFKFKIEIDIYTPAEDEELSNETLEKLKVSYVKNFEDINLSPKINDKPEKEYIPAIGYNYVPDLFNKFIFMLTNEQDTVDILDENKLGGVKTYLDLDGKIFTFIYDDITKPYHCKKIKNIVLALFFYFSKKVEECNSKQKILIGTGDDEKILETILNFYVTEDAAFVSPFQTFMQDK